MATKIIYPDCFKENQHEVVKLKDDDLESPYCTDRFYGGVEAMELGKYHDEQYDIVQDCPTAGTIHKLCHLC